MLASHVTEGKTGKRRNLQREQCISRNTFESSVSTLFLFRPQGADIVLWSEFNLNIR